MNKSESKLKFISILSDVLGITSFITTLIPVILGFTTNTKIYFLLGLVFLIVLIIVSLKRKSIATALLKKIMNLTCPDKMYKLKEKEVLYEFIDREHMRHEKTFIPEVLHDGFTGIDDKFKWTGEGALIPTAKYETQEIEMLDQKFGMQRYRIKFKNGIRYSSHDNVAKMGMVIESIEDLNKTSSLHLASGVFEVTDKLILKLSFPQDLTPKNIRFLEYIHYSDDEHYSCKEGTYDFNQEKNKNEIIWEIKKPYFGGKYMIDWNF